MGLLWLGNRSVEQMPDKTCGAGSEIHELTHTGNSRSTLLYHFPKFGTHRQTFDQNGATELRNTTYGNVNNSCLSWGNG